MSFRKPTNIKDFLIHLLVLLGVAIIIVAIVFYVWLPITTNHGETIAVPNIQGMTVNELKKFLTKRNLRFEVTADSSYSANHTPLTVLRQIPKPNTYVKENRKIYVTLNTKNPPKIRMPNMVDKSLKSAMMMLSLYDLKLGEITYVPDEFFNVIIEIRVNNKIISEGELIEKGSEVSIKVGNGYGNTIFQTPNLLGLDQEEAEFTIIGSGLKIGKIKFINNYLVNYDTINSKLNDAIKFPNNSSGIVVKQNPEPNEIVEIGDIIDIWIQKIDTVKLKSTLLNN